MDYCEICDGIIEIKRVENKVYTYCADCDEYNQIGGGDEREELVLDNKDQDSLVDIIRNQSIPRAKRIDAVKSIENVAVLEKLAFDVSSVSVLMPLIGRINNPEVLMRIASTTKSVDIWKKATKGIIKDSGWLWLATKTDDKSFRSMAQKKITDDKVLLQVLKEENDRELIITMVSRMEDIISSVTDEELLRHFAQYSHNNRSSTKAIRRINNQQILKELVINITYYKQSIECINRIHDQKILEGLLEEDLYWRIVVIIVKKVKDPDKLYAVALREKAFGVFRTAIINLANQSENEKLIQLAIHASNHRSRIEAIKRVDDIDVLREIFSNEKNEEVRWAINKRIKALDK